MAGENIKEFPEPGIVILAGCQDVGFRYNRKSGEIELVEHLLPDSGWEVAERKPLPEEAWNRNAGMEGMRFMSELTDRVYDLLEA